MSDSHINDKGNVENSNDHSHDDKINKFGTDEFMEGVIDDFDPAELPHMSRRKFLALVSASAALTATACSDYKDKGEIVPYTNRPEEILPGKANYYASTCNGCAQSCGVLIKTREGRPIKVDGNPDHPINQGKICAKGQSSILNLYDPERLQNPKIAGVESDWITIDKNVVNQLNAANDSGKEIVFISHSNNSPTQKKLLDDFKTKYPTAKSFSYKLFDNTNRLNAWKKSYGNIGHPSYMFDKAKVILSIEADFLGREGDTIENTRLFTSGRDVMKSKEFNRLYVAEGGMSLTGMNSDYRFRVRPDAQYEFVMCLINEIIRLDRERLLLSGSLMEKTQQYHFSQVIEKLGLNETNTRHLINDLIENGGKGLVYGGDTLHEETHVAINLLNEILGNTALYNYESIPNILEETSSNEKWLELIKAMNDGKVGVVIHLDSNPVYHLSPDYKYSEALKNINTKIAFVESENETSVKCNYVLPINNQFESWGDAYSRKDVYSLQQPVIAPIFNTRQKEAVLLHWLNGNLPKYDENIYHKYLMQNFQTEIYSKQKPPVEFNTFWYSALHDGVVKINIEAESHKPFLIDDFTSIKDINPGDGYVVHLQDSYFIGDGRYANNGWLQELPHPVTKVAWDNFAMISPNTAGKLNVANNDLLKITATGKEIELPVMVQPGVAEKLIVVELGYGRSIIGDVGKDVGVNANILLGGLGSSSRWIIENAAVEKAEGTYKLVSTQEHHSLDDTFVKDLHRKRKIILEGTVDEYKSNPHFLHEEDHKVFSITENHEYKDKKWAMSIDLNKCIGCNACVSSCNVENNVPVVGKDQVGKGREMQWIRLDRYYSGTPEDPVTSNQPMLCQHCDNAPCENVCPVNATNHSPDGLNQMAYNRCVGTRYCANNCPYKVRRFNFFNFRDHFEDSYYENELTSLVNNPEVTVRSRGVMEKCTFCVQRIMDARSEAIKEGRELNGSDVITACQQACPSQAIVFGDANDKESEIAKYRAHNLGYHVLDELNVKPNVTYIAKLRNTLLEES